MRKLLWCSIVVVGFLVAGCILDSSDEGKIIIRNELTTTILGVYISRSQGTIYWGDNKLREGDLLFSESSRTYKVEARMWDIRLVDAENKSYTRWRVDIAKGETYTWPVLALDADP